MNFYIRNILYFLRTWISLSPSLYRWWASGREDKGKHLWCEGTEIVIEGFPRSGNSFAVRAFRAAQDKDIAIAHHFHSSGQVVLAVRRDVPVLVLVRRPDEAVASLLVRDTCLCVPVALLEYIMFHLVVLRCKDKIVVADFNEIIFDFGSVVEAVNKKFNKSFSVYRNDELQDLGLLKKSILENRLMNKGKDNVDDLASAPSKIKSKKKKIISQRYSRVPNNILLRWANCCYEGMVK